MHHIGGVSHSVSQPLPSLYKSDPALPANKQKSNYKQHQRNPAEGVSTMPLTHSVQCHKVQERPRTCSRMKKQEMWPTRPCTMLDPWEADGQTQINQIWGCPLVSQLYGCTIGVWRISLVEEIYTKVLKDWNPSHSEPYPSPRGTVGTFRMRSLLEGLQRGMVCLPLFCFQVMRFNSPQAQSQRTNTDWNDLFSL